MVNTTGFGSRYVKSLTITEINIEKIINNSKIFIISSFIDSNQPFFCALAGRLFNLAMACFAIVSKVESIVILSRKLLNFQFISVDQVEILLLVWIRASSVTNRSLPIRKLVDDDTSIIELGQAFVVLKQVKLWR